MIQKFFQLAIILGMSCSLIAQQTPSTTETAQTQQATNANATFTPPAPNTLLDGTPVKLRLSQTISSADAKVGQEIPFEVIEDISVDNIVVLPKGSVAIATVTDAEHKKSMGRAGKLNISISYARLKDQEKLALRAVKDSKGGGHTGAMTGAMVATAIVFWPAAPLFLFIHGKDISIPQGTEITAFVQGDMHLNMSNFGAPNATAASASAQGTLEIESTPSNADIEIDGVFVGNTPSSLPVELGMREIKVSKKGYQPWTRKMNISGGKIHLDAELDVANTAATPTPIPTTTAPMTSTSTPAPPNQP